MTKPTPADVTLIERALLAIQEAIAHSELNDVPFFGPTTLGALPADEREAVEKIEMQVCQELPEQTAIHFCLSSASALLGVAHILMCRDHAPSPQEREREWDALVAHTKKAGRGAYRAALVLTDTKRATA